MTGGASSMPILPFGYRPDQRILAAARGFVLTMALGMADFGPIAEA
jgi:hypothetical protein